MAWIRATLSPLLSATFSRESVRPRGGGVSVFGVKLHDRVVWYIPLVWKGVGGGCVGGRDVGVFFRDRSAPTSSRGVRR